MLTRFRAVAWDQLTGVTAQVCYGAPAIVSSLVLARFADLRLVADLAVAFALASTIFVAASFNLSQGLALWGTRGHSIQTLWVNRVLSSAVAGAAGTVVLALVGIDLRIALFAALLKFSDALADLAFGIRLLSHAPGASMRVLLRWSLTRLGWFGAGTAVGLLLTDGGGVEALLIGGVLQFAVMVPWTTVDRGRVDRRALGQAVALGRATAHLAVAGTASGLLVTTPRLLATLVVPEEVLGYHGTAFVASTLIGMAFNVAWYRLAAATRDSDPAAALRTFLLEGSLLAIVLVLGLGLSVPVVARLFGVPPGPFGIVFMTIGSALVVLYFTMALANLLKTSRYRLLEAAAYVAAATTLAAASVGLRSLSLAILLASLVLLAFVLVGVRAMREVVRG